MMLVSGLLFGGNVFAQTDATTGATTQKEAVKKGDKVKMARQQGRPEIRQKFNPFDGIQLTEDQQQRLQELQKGIGPVQLTTEQKAKIKENKNLTDEQKKQLREERQAKKLEDKKKYLNGVKATLNPDQYIIFLENCYLYAPQEQAKATSMKRGTKVDRQGPRLEKKGKSASK